MSKFSLAGWLGVIRSAIVLGIVAGVLLCPLRCLGVFAGSSGPRASVKKACCARCAKKAHKNATDKRPAEGERDGAGGQCLCGGCLLLAAGEGAQRLEFDQHCIGRMVLCALTCPDLDWTKSQRGGRDPALPPPASGRCLHLALHSILI
jgi:hypothetical protein